MVTHSLIGVAASSRSVLVDVEYRSLTSGVLLTKFVLPAPTVEAMPAAAGTADSGASSEKKPKNTKGADEPPANTVAPAKQQAACHEMRSRGQRTC